MKSKKLFHTRWLIIATAFTAAIILLTHLPQEALPSRLQSGGLDKAAHMLGYGLITLLFVLSLRSSASLLSGFILLIVILVVGAADELTQPFVNRIASLADWLADLVGVTSVLLFFYIARRITRRTYPVKSLCEET